MDIRISLHRPSKRAYGLAGILLLVVLTLLIIWWFRLGSSPFPADIRKQLNFKGVYPALTASIKEDSIGYKADQHLLSFTISYKSQEIVFTEQKRPNNLATGTQIYFQALGIHPTAQFATKLGSVAIANFYKPGTLEFSGQAAILATDDTLAIATPRDKQKLTDEDWKILFDSLKISR